MTWISDLIEGVGRLITGSRKPKPARFNQPHAWRSWRLTRAGSAGELVKLEPPICDYCQQEQTVGNHYAPCPGPAIEAQR